MTTTPHCKLVYAFNDDNIKVIALYLVNNCNGLVLSDSFDLYSFSLENGVSSIILIHSDILHLVPIDLRSCVYLVTNGEIGLVYENGERKLVARAVSTLPSAPFSAQVCAMATKPWYENSTVVFVAFPSIGFEVHISLSNDANVSLVDFITYCSVRVHIESFPNSTPIFQSFPNTTLCRLWGDSRSPLPLIAFESSIISVTRGLKSYRRSDEGHEAWITALSDGENSHFPLFASGDESGHFVLWEIDDQSTLKVFTSTTFTDSAISCIALDTQKAGGFWLSDSRGCISYVTADIISKEMKRLYVISSFLLDGPSYLQWWGYEYNDSNYPKGVLRAVSLSSTTIWEYTVETSVARMWQVNGMGPAVGVYVFGVDVESGILVSAGSDRQCYLWDLETGALLCEINGEDFTFTSLACFCEKDSEQLNQIAVVVSGHSNGRTHEYKIPMNQPTFLNSIGYNRGASKIVHSDDFMYENLPYMRVPSGSYPETAKDYLSLKQRITRATSTSSSFRRTSFVNFDNYNAVADMGCTSYHPLPVTSIFVSQGKEVCVFCYAQTALVIYSRRSRCLISSIPLQGVAESISVCKCAAENGRSNDQMAVAVKLARSLTVLYCDDKEVNVVPVFYLEESQTIEPHFIHIELDAPTISVASASNLIRSIQGARKFSKNMLCEEKNIPISSISRTPMQIRSRGGFCVCQGEYGPIIYAVDSKGLTCRVLSVNDDGVASVDTPMRSETAVFQHQLVNEDQGAASSSSKKLRRKKLQAPVPRDLDIPKPRRCTRADALIMGMTVRDKIVIAWTLRKIYAVVKHDRGSDECVYSTSTHNVMVDVSDSTGAKLAGLHKPRIVSIEIAGPTCVCLGSESGRNKSNNNIHNSSLCCASCRYSSDNNTRESILIMLSNGNVSLLKI